MNAIAQGKSHVSFVEAAGKLWFATHTGFYAIIDDMEKMGIPPPGMKPYRAGTCSPRTWRSHKFEDLGLAPAGEGILTMNMDPPRGASTASPGPPASSSATTSEQEHERSGVVFRAGREWKRRDYRTICRSLAVDPRDGSVYFSLGEGSIWLSLPPDAVERSTATKSQGLLRPLRPASPGHMAYNWRQVFWYPPESVFYGVHGNSGYLFRFDPRAGASTDRAAHINAVAAERHVRSVQLRIPRFTSVRMGRRSIT